MAPQQTGAAKTAAGGSSVRGRTKHEQDQLQRKTVYRPVLDNPLTVAWPPLPASVRKSILDQLLPILTGPQGPDNKSVAEWRAEEHAARRHKSVGKGKGKNDPKNEFQGKKGKGKEVKASVDATQKEEDADMSKDIEKESTTKKVKVSKPTSETKSSKDQNPPRGLHPSQLRKPPRQPTPCPPILDYLSVGINEVTKALETRIRWARWELGDSKAIPGASQLLQPTQESKLIPTAATDLDATDAGPSVSAPNRPRQRLRKKSNPTSFSPQVTLKLDSIDYSSLPGYEFLASPTPRPSDEETPPYFIKSTVDHPSPRLLLNSETLRIRRAVKKDVKDKDTESKKEERGSVSEKEKKVTGEKKEAKQGTKKEKVIPAEKPGGDVPMTDGKNEETKDPIVEGGKEENPTEEEELSTVPLIDLVFVCKPDINPPSLVAHLPGMVAAANGVQVAIESILESDAAKRQARRKEKAEEGMEIDSKEEKQEIEKRPEFRKLRLVPLDQGAERVLADALGLRRVAAIGMSSSAPGAQDLLDLVQKHLQPPLAPWLTPHLLHPAPSSTKPHPSIYVETHIKHLKTSAPLNPRAAHVEKKRKRKSEKEERKRKKRTSEKAGEVYEAQDDDGGEEY
ncbi:hypothetical protein JCM5350_001457 [Sporobolomyces pararoseus]